MPTTINLGDNYVVEEDSNDDLVLRHTSNGDVLKYDASADEISALKALQSLSTDEIATGFEDGSGVTSSRDYGTAYQNTNGYDIWVYTVSTALAAGESGILTATVADASADLSSGDNRIDASFADGDTEIDSAVVSFRVPDGHYYQVSNSGNIATGDVGRWNERGFTGG